MQDLPIQDLDFGQLAEGLADGSILVVDVREPYELLGGVIPGSVSVPLSQFDPALIPDGPQRIVFSCAAGVRSRHAVEFCRRLGLPHREHYVGGFKGWVSSGGPVVPWNPPE